MDAVRASIAGGRQGQMPAQLDRLGAQRVKLLAAYVLSLSDAASGSAGVDHGAATN